MQLKFVVILILIFLISGNDLLTLKEEINNMMKNCEPNFVNKFGIEDCIIESNVTHPNPFPMELLCTAVKDSFFEVCSKRNNSFDFEKISEFIVKHNSDNSDKFCSDTRMNNSNQTKNKSNATELLNTIINNVQTCNKVCGSMNNSLISLCPLLHAIHSVRKTDLSHTSLNETTPILPNQAKNKTEVTSKNPSSQTYADSTAISPKEPVTHLLGKPNENSNWFSYSMMLMPIFCVLIYIIYNKKKILALMIEGRKRNVKRRSSHSAAYTKLDCNLEEAMASGPSTSSSNMLLY